MAFHVLLDVEQLVGGVHFETVVTQPAQQLPLVVQAQLVLHIQGAAFDFGVVVTRQSHAPGVAQAAIGLVEVQARHRLAIASGVQLRITALAAQLNTGEQAVFQAKGVETAFQLQVVEHVAGGQVLLPVLAGDGVGFRLIAGLVGIVEITVELEHAEGVAQLPVGVELVGESGTQGLGLIVDVIAVIKVSGAAAHIRRAPVDARNATVWGAVVAAVFVLHQPVQLWSELPAHRRREQLAVAADAIAKAVVVLVAHVQAQADVIGGVGTQVGIQAAQIVAAALGFDAGLLPWAWQFAHPVDDPALAASPVKHGGRSLEHFDTLDVMQVTYVLAVVANAIQIEVIAGVETTYAHAVEACIGAAADVGDTAQCLAQLVGAIGAQAFGFD